MRLIPKHWRALAAALALAACTPAEVASDRLPKFVAPPSGSHPKVALVLGSGGPRGFAHIGVLKVLEENGLKPDLVIGSSVGAMVGAMYAAGVKADELERMAHQLNVMEFFDLRSLAGGLSSGKAIQAYVNEKVGNRSIEALPTRFAAAATRLSDHKLVLFNHGDTGLAVRASSASPGQFEPVQVGDQFYVDGDEASPVPIRAARALGARFVIAVDVSAFEKDTPAGVPQEWIDKDARRLRQITKEASEADVILHPNIGYYAGYKEAYRKHVIDVAEQYTREQLPTIRAKFAAAGLALEAPQTASTDLIPSGRASR
jgi:NTE family protein